MRPLRPSCREGAALLALLPVAGFGLAAAPPLVEMPAAAAGGQPLPAAEAMAIAGPAAAAAPLPAWSIEPRLTLSETLTNNINLASRDRQGEWVTEISPGIRINNRSARSNLHLDYRISEFLYARSSEQRSTRNFLNAFGNLEAIDRWLYLDAQGTVAQQQISPFGRQSPNEAALNPNRTETASFRLSPYLRGRLGGDADYELRYAHSSTRSRSRLPSDVDSDEGSARVTGSTPFASLGWSLEARRRRIDFRSGSRTEEDRSRAMLSYRFDPQFRILASGGREANDFETPGKSSHATHGYGFDWWPTTRTQVSAFREKRFFGYGHEVLLLHRTPLSAWKWSDSRDVALLPNQFATPGLGTVYDLVFNQLASSQPDPFARAQETDRLLEQSGISPGVQPISGFLATRPTVQRRQELSFMLRGARNMLVLAAARSDSREIGPATGSDDPFRLASAIRQRGVSLTLSHALTPLSSLNLTAAVQRSSGAGAADLSTIQKSLSPVLLVRLGPASSAAFGFRRTLFHSSTSPYSENAVTATLIMQF